ncbi:MAG: FkbM family methyltransferase [Acidimicrobiales bacterium]
MQNSREQVANTKGGTTSGDEVREGTAAGDAPTVNVPKAGAASASAGASDFKAGRTEIISYAQNDEDIMLLRALGDIDAGVGFYVDVGAQDPVVDSVTKAFYERGWHGINVEPVQYWYDRLVADRPRDINLNVAASSSSGKERFFEVHDTGLSTAKEEFAHDASSRGYDVRETEVVTRKLDDIISIFDPEQIHFLKIDVEGAEKEVLEGLDLTTVHPWIVVVEAMTPARDSSDMEPSHEEWEYILTGAGYDYVYFDGLNRFYVADEHGSCADAFEFPPSYWRDWYIPYREHQLRQELAQERQVNSHLHQELAQLRQAEGRSRAVEEDLTRKLREAKQQIFNLEQEVKSRRAELSAVYGSTSWRITRPMRSSSPTVVKLRRAYKESRVYSKFLSPSFSRASEIPYSDAAHDLSCYSEEALRLYGVLKSSIESTQKNERGRTARKQGQV